MGVTGVGVGVTGVGVGVIGDGGVGVGVIGDGGVGLGPPVPPFGEVPGGHVCLEASM